MALASLPETKHMVKKLCVVDMTTRKTPLTGSFKRYIQKMKEIDSMGVTSKKEAEKILREVESDDAIVQFLLTNLVPFKKLHETAQVIAIKSGKRDPESLRIRVNLDAILASPVEIEEVIFGKPEEGRKDKLDSLFVYGTKAKYVLEEDRKDILEHFPSAKFAPVNAGHWLHAEKPEEFIQITTEFLKAN